MRRAWADAIGESDLVDATDADVEPEPDPEDVEGEVGACVQVDRGSWGAPRALARAGDSTPLHPDEEPDDDPPRKLTRQEQLEGLADRGIDTWADYREEK